MLQWRLFHLLFHFFILQLLHSASSTFSNINIQTQYHIHHQGLMVEDEYEKTRLGSTPPSCHNKCNRCHPCMAVQAPSSSLPSHHRFHPSSTHDPLLPLDSSYNKYSNYKPLGWKCRCGDHFYNP